MEADGLTFVACVAVVAIFAFAMKFKCGPKAVSNAWTNVWIKIVRNIFRNCLVISKISCNFASPLGEMYRRDNANLLRVRGVGASNVYKGNENRKYRNTNNYKVKQKKLRCLLFSN